MQQSNLYPSHFMEQNENDLPLFELVSAGLVNFLPGIPIARHAGIFQQLRSNQHVNNMEQQNTALLSQLCFEEDAQETLMQLKTSPAIICTMHTGAYRLLNLFLIQQHIPIAIVMGTRVLHEQGETFREIFRSFDSNASTSLQLINAEDPNSMREMIRTLGEGTSLVLYLDGQTGAGEDTARNKNNCIVNFLAQQLYARKGIAWLAYRTKVPIIPILSYRQETTNKIRSYPTIMADRQPDKASFVQAATQQLYDYFSELIKEQPGQWEGWLSIHHTAKIIHDTSKMQMKENKNGENLLFNSYRFGVFKTGDVPMLLEKHRYLFYPVEDDLYLLLQDCRHAPLPVAQVHKEVAAALLEKGMVIRV